MSGAEDYRRSALSKPIGWPACSTANIVPVYSVHRRGRLSGVCMPYLGGVTLADFIARLKAARSLAESAQPLVDTVAARQAELSTVVEDADAKSVEVPESRAARLPPMSVGKTRRSAAGRSNLLDRGRVAAGLAHAHAARDRRTAI